MVIWSLLLVTAAAAASAVPRFQDTFSLWQWSSPVVAPNAPRIPPLKFASVWHFDGPHKRLLLRTGSPDSSSFVLHRGDFSPARMYFYDTAKKSCGGIDLPIGPPRADWLSGPNGTFIGTVYIAPTVGEGEKGFVRTDLWCKDDVPGYIPFCSYWDGNILLRLTAPPGGPGVPGNRMILNEYTRYTPGPQSAELFDVPEYCTASSPPLSPADWAALPFPYSHHGEDVTRALRAKPGPSFAAVTPSAVSLALNAHLRRTSSRVIDCELWSLGQLESLRRALEPLLAPEYHALYEARRDRRQRRQMGVPDDHEEDAAERTLAEYHKDHSDALSTQIMDAVRAGHCAELVMWYVHHLPAATRTTWSKPIPALALSGMIAFPTIPNYHPLVHVVDTLRERYMEQSSCLDCHYQPGPSFTLQ